MTVYIVTLVIVAILGMLAQTVNNHLIYKEKVLSTGAVKRKNRYSFFYPLIIFTLSFVGGFRYYVGTDFGGYYKNYDYKWDEVVTSFKELDEPLLKILSYGGRLIWDDGVAVILFTMIIIVLLIFYGISKYDDGDIALYSIFYIIMGVWTFAFNGVRQGLAIAILFAGVSAIKDMPNTLKKYVYLFIVCFVAYLAHKSALMILPIIILSFRKFDKTQIVLLVIAAFAVPLFFNYGYQFMGVDMENEEAMTYITNSVNPIRIAVAFTPLVLMFFITDKEKFYEENGFVLSMAFIHAILMLTTRNSAYLNRITNYTSVFAMVYLVKGLKNSYGVSKFALRSSAIILYFSYWMYEISNNDNMKNFEWSFKHFGEF